MQCHYRNGRLHGTEKEWSEDGKLQSSKAYTDGMQIPVWVNNLLVSGTLKAEHILRIGNTAVRRFCLEALGYSRFLAQMKHEVVEKEGDLNNESAQEYVTNMQKEKRLQLDVY